MIKGICFDVSETLLIRDDEFNKQLQELRHNLYKDATGAIDPKTDYESAYEKAGSHSAVFSQLGLPINYWQSQIHELDDNYTYEPNKAINTTLHTLYDRKYPLYVCTNRTKIGIMKKLKSIDINTDWFAGFVTNESMSKPKPDQAAFKSVIEIANLPSQQILFVGDRVETDILPAKAVGMQTCIVWSSSDKADYSAPDFSEILEIVKNN